jgi:CARDB
VGFFDDETSRAPADAGGPPSAPSSRRRPDRRRTRIQRFAILALVLFVVVFGIAWWARSCQHNRKVESFRTYFDGVGAAIDDSVALGKQVSTIMDDPTKLSRKELIEKLEQLTAQQDEIAVRAGRLEPPGALDDEQTVFATDMKVRASGFRLLRTAMLGALSNKKVGVKEITALDGYFSGPDAYYQELVYQPARETMADEGVSDVAVPTSTFYLTWKALDPATVTLALESVGKSSKLTGIHGVALIDVTAKGSSGDLKLVRGRTNDVPASPDLSFVVQVQNQGSVTEKNVPVTATLVLPGGDTIKQEESIASIESNKTQDVTISGFAIPTEALSKEVTLKVVAGPVKGERVETNNNATYKLLLQLK